MAKTVVGLFDTWDEAQSVVRELERMGFSDNDISVIANQTSTGYSADDSDHSSAGSRVGHAVGDGVKGAVKGGLIGGLTGLAASFALLAIPGVGPVLAAGPIAASLGGAGTVTAATLGGASLGATAGGIIGALTGLGIPDEEAHHYSEGIRRGGTLVSVHTDDNRADEIMAIFNRHNPVDIEQRGSSYRQSGYSGYTPDAPHYTADQIAAERSNYATAAAPMPSSAGTTGSSTPAPATSMDNSTRTVQTGEQVAIPVVEEQLQVGKREVNRGGARIHTRVTETPVQETVSLREEHVTVDRHPVNRAVTATDQAAFREGTIEVTEHAEQAVVAKQARVVEEVVVGKEATQRTETVQDTVRRTDVDVEELNSGDTSTSSTSSSTTTGTGRTNY